MHRLFRITVWPLVLVVAAVLVGGAIALAHPNDRHRRLELEVHAGEDLHPRQRSHNAAVDILIRRPWD